MVIDGTRRPRPAHARPRPLKPPTLPPGNLDVRCRRGGSTMCRSAGSSRPSERGRQAMGARVLRTSARSRSSRSAHTRERDDRAREVEAADRALESGARQIYAVDSGEDRDAPLSALRAVRLTRSSRDAMLEVKSGTRPRRTRSRSWQTAFVVGAAAKMTGGRRCGGAAEGDSRRRGDRHSSLPRRPERRARTTR